MDKKITLRFYEVGRLRPNGPSLRSVLEEIFDSGPPEDREADIAAGYRVRLERLEVAHGEIAGEFTRVQTTNYPSEVRADGVTALDVDGPLGHGIAFRFRPRDHILAMQYDTRVLAPSRAFAYLLEMRADAAFEIRPCMNRDAWRRMQRRPLKKLTIRIASAPDLADIEDAGGAVAAAVQTLGEAYSAPSVTIQLGMGGRKGSLGDAAKEMARHMYELFNDEQIDLRGLKATSETEPGVPNEEINLIDDVLSSKEELTLPDNDPERNYIVRRNWLRTKLQQYG